MYYILGVKMRNEKGQVIVILLLVMVVGLTVGLSVVSRSLLNVKQSAQTEESSRAFTAAEAGIEVALESGFGESGLPIEGDVGDSNYTCKKTDQGSSDKYVFYNLEKDKVAQFYFADPGNLDNQVFSGDMIHVLWGSNAETNLSTPALEVNLIYKNREDKSYHLAKFAFDPSSRGNHFTSVGSGMEVIRTSDKDVEFWFGSDINVSSFNSGNYFLIFGRFRFLYNPAPSNLGIIATGGNFPSQGSIIDCLGTVAETGVSRRIKVFENHPAVPEVFDYVLFNGNPSRPLGH